MEINKNYKFFDTKPSPYIMINYHTHLLVLHMQPRYKYITPKETNDDNVIDVMNPLFSPYNQACGLIGLGSSIKHP